VVAPLGRLYGVAINPSFDSKKNKRLPEKKPEASE